MTQSRSATIGLVGCGLFGESHLQAFRAVPLARVDAVFDADPDRATAIAAEFGIPKVCRSLNEICSLPLDAIDIVTPEHLHLEPVLHAIAAGKHVFVEKPLALKLDECARMISAAQNSGKVLMAGHILRFETKYAMLKEQVAAGRLGRVVSMHARRNRPKALLPRYGRTHPALENSIHDIDLMLWYTGAPVTRVRGWHRNATGGRHPDTFWGMIEFGNGAVGVVETIWLLPQAGVSLDDSFQLIGTAGVGNINLVPPAISYWRDDGFEAPDFSYDPGVGNSARGALREELTYFTECVLEGRQPSVIRAAEAARAVRVTLGLIESAETGREVEMIQWD